MKMRCFQQLRLGLGIQIQGFVASVMVDITGRCQPCTVPNQYRDDQISKEAENLKGRVDQLGLPR